MGATIMKPGPLNVDTGHEPQEQAAPIRCHPCSPAQERFWILDRLLPGNPWS